MEGRDVLGGREVVAQIEVDETKAVKIVEREYFHLHILDLEIGSTARLHVQFGWTAYFIPSPTETYCTLRSRSGTDNNIYHIKFNSKSMENVIFRRISTAIARWSGSLGVTENLRSISLRN